MLPAESFKFVNNTDFFAAIIFQSPRSPQWPIVWGLCQSADAISEGKGYYAAAFYCTENSLETLTSICHITQEWKTAHLFVRKKKIAHIYSVRWVNCFLKSLKCPGNLAWCLDITRAPKRIDDFTSLDHTITINLVSTPFAERKPDRIVAQELFICPCKQLSAFPWGKMELPVPLKEQFHAFAVERGFIDCPNFDIEEFRPVFDTYDIK